MQGYNFEIINRGDRIWTDDLLRPMQARYQAAPHPENDKLFNLCWHIKKIQHLL